MCELLLIRHGQTDWNAGRKVMGRQPIGINAVGERQLRALASALRTHAVHAIYASPTARTQQSAALIAENYAVPVQEIPEFVEIDYGDWVNEPFANVESQEIFSDYLLRPSQMQIPGGERPREVLERVQRGLARLREQHDGARVVVVSHADVIKAALLHVLGAPLDQWQQLHIDNGSLSVVRYHAHGPRVATANWAPTTDAIFVRDAFADIRLAKP